MTAAEIAILVDTVQRIRTLLMPRLAGATPSFGIASFARHFPRMGITIPEPPTNTDAGRRSVADLPGSTPRLAHLRPTLEIPHEVQLGEQLRILQHAAALPRFARSAHRHSFQSPRPEIALSRATEPIAAQALNRTPDPLAERPRSPHWTIGAMSSAPPLQRSTAPTFSFAPGAIQITAANVSEGEVRSTVSSSLTRLVAESARASGTPARRTLPGVI